MKILKSLFFVLLLTLSEIANAQHFTITLNPGNVIACADATPNVVSLTVNCISTTQTYASNIYVAIDLTSTINPPTDNQVILNAPNVYNNPGPGIVFVDLGSNQFNAGAVVNKTFTLVLNCNSIKLKSNAGQHTDLVYMTVGQSLTNALPTSDWTLLSSSGSTATNYTWQYSLNYAYLTFQNSTDVAVNYFDWQTPGNVTRTLDYIVSTTNDVPGLTYPIKINFSETSQCNLVNIVNLNISQIRAGSVIQQFNFTGTASIISTSGNLSFLVQDLDLIRVVETFDYSGYATDCVVDACSNNTKLNSTFNWGCVSLNYDGTISNPDLCNSIPIENSIVRGNARPLVTVSRTLPLPSNLPSNSVWDQNPLDGSNHLWQFEIENNGGDIAKNLSFGIDQGFNNESAFYFLSSGNLIVTDNAGVVITPTTINPATSQSPTPNCLLNNPQAIKNAFFDIPVLAPGERITVNMTLTYCCPSADIGGTGNYSAFDRDKYLNDWNITVHAYDECNTNLGFIGGRTDATHFGIEPISNLSMNSNQGKLYLTQLFTPASLDLEADDQCVSSTLNLNINNFEFNIGQYNLYDYNSANIFSSLQNHNDPANVIQGELIFKIQTERGLEFLTDLSPFDQSGNPRTPDYRLINLSDQSVWQPRFPAIGGLVCSPHATEIRYNLQDIPGGATVDNVISLLNNSVFNFNITSCCCTAPANNNPHFIVQTFLNILGNSCEVPLCEKDAECHIHCPGCELPGGVVKGATKILERRTFGFEDANNDGLADNLNTLTPAYIAAQNNQIALNKSIVGDQLVTEFHGKIDNTGSIRMSNMDAQGVHLGHLYIDQQIERSNSSEFDVNLYQLELTITQGAYSFSVTLNKGTAAFNTVVHDRRDQQTLAGDYDDLFLYDLSESVIRGLSGNATFTFQGNEQVDMVSHFSVCRNHFTGTNSSAPADNEFLSIVHLYMYLSHEDLVSLSVYNAYTFNSFYTKKIAQEEYAAGVFSYDPTYLYYCEGLSGNHYFYSVRPIVTIQIDDNDNNTGSNCRKLLKYNNITSIGGSLYNIFPFEFRSIPSIQSVNFHLPGPLNQYNFLPTNGTGTFSKIRTYNDAISCSVVQYHQMNYQPNLPYSALLTLPTAVATDALRVFFPNVPCSSPGTTPQNSFYSSDEYLNETSNFPFTWNTCNNGDVFSTIYNTATIPYVDVNYDLGMPPAQTTCQSLMTHSENFDAQHRAVTSPTIDFIASQPNTQLVNTPTITLNLQLQNNDPNQTIINPFIYLPLPGSPFFNVLSIDGNAPTILNLTTGSIAIAPIQTFNQGASRTVTIVIEFTNCTAASATIPVYYGWNCSSGLPSAADFNSGNICSYTNHSDFPLNFVNTQVNPIWDNSTLVYQTCVTYSREFILEIVDGYIDNLEFNFTQYDQTLSNVLVEFSYSPAGPVFTNLSSAPPSIQNFNTTTYDLSSAIQPYLGYLQAGNRLKMKITFTPTQIWNGIPQTPFGITYHYTTYCGASGNSQGMIGLASYTPDVIPGCILLNVQTSNNLLICQSAPIQIFTTTSNGVPGYSYAWSVSPSGTIPTGQNPTVNPSVTTVYTVVVTDSRGYTGSASITVEVEQAANCCIPPGYNSSPSSQNFSGRSVAGGANPLGFSSISTNDIILINGTFYVDADFTFTSCHNIVLGPGAVIDVSPNVTLTLDDSHIYSCSQMSEGILAREFANVKLFGTTIEDAARAINLLNGAGVESKTSYFYNDYIGINSQTPPGYAGLFQIGVNISDTYFDCQRNLVAPYPGQLDIVKTHTLAGILTRNVSLLDLSSGSSPIYFSNLNSGINLTATNTIIKNCKFSEMRNYDNYPSLKYNEGSAILCRSKATSRYITQVGLNDRGTPDFVNCIFGINTQGYNQDVQGNVMINCDFGIISKITKLATINIIHNVIECNVAGISLLSNDQPNGINILENEIDAGKYPTDLKGNVALATGIDIENNQMNYGFSSSMVNDNWIKLYDNGTKGIHLNSLVQYTLNSNFVHISNIVRTDQTGLLIENCEKNMFTCNALFGTRIDQDSYYSQEAGIRISTSKNNFYSQNTVNATSNGMIFHGACADISNAGLTTNFQKNQFGNHYYGLHYTTSAIMNAQDHSGNIWLTSVVTPKYNAIEENILRAPIDLYLVTNLGNCLPTSIFPLSGWFIPSPGANLIIKPEDCGEGPVLPGDESLSRLIQIALDSLESIDFKDELLLQSKIALYQYLMQNPDQLNLSSELYNFYVQNASSAIHYIASLSIDKDNIYVGRESEIADVKNRSFDIYIKTKSLLKCDSLIKEEGNTDSLMMIRNYLIYQIDNLIKQNQISVSAISSSIENKWDLFSQKNDLLGGTSLIEENEKKVNSIYFRNIVKEEYDSLRNDSLILSGIARQCPIAGGPAVFRARSLYKLLNPYFSINDDVSCMQSGYNYRSPKNSVQFRIYPNPTTGEFDLEYAIKNDCRVEVVDFCGRLIKSFKIYSTQNSIRESLSSFDNGIYYCRIVDNDSILIGISKIVVSK